jgi:uncharacterized protein (DUF1800 family)
MTSRRRFLKTAGLAGLSGLFAACNRFPSLEWAFGYGLGTKPVASQWQDTLEERRAAHLLKRLAYGPRPGDIDRVAEKRAEDFIEEQLHPESLGDSKAYWLTRRIETIHMKAPDIYELPAETAIGDLRRSMLLRAVYSERQLLEVMVEFWSDHFNIFASKSDCAWLKVIDDRDVIRPHALGLFRDLLRASATSPAMLVYLDGQTNVKGKPNENYARELMELHTMGVDGGYTQKDVMELARALTGWRVKKHFWRGQVSFEAEAHDRTPKLVLGNSLTEGNETDLEQVIEMLGNHPATARFMSLKLCRRFVGNEPSEDLVGRVAKRFEQSQGDIRETLRELLLSEEFLNAPPLFKRPYTYTVSALRALGASTDGGEHIQRHLQAMGQLPFGWPTPDGYPENESHWQSQLLARWNFAIELVSGNIKGTSIEPESFSDLSEVAPALLQRKLSEREMSLIDGAGNRADGLALIICMPDFQY